MADESATPVAPETPPAAPAPTTNQPTRHQHTETLLGLARDVGIPPDRAEMIDAAALRQEIQDAHLALQIRQARQPVSRQQPAPAPEAEEKFQIPVELRAELAAVDPAVLKLIESVGSEAIKGRKAAEEVRQLRQEQRNRELQEQVVQVLDQLPATGGSKASRNKAVINELGDLERAGELQGLSVGQAVAKAYGNVYGARTANPPPPPPPPPAAPRATTTARPTNRLPADLQGTLDHLNGNTSDDFVP